MTLAGLTLPELSAYDPPVAGEGSLDPMGLAAISDRLADRLVPGLRARMQRVRFVTAMAVGATGVRDARRRAARGRDLDAGDLLRVAVIEGFVRRLPPQLIPQGVPGSRRLAPSSAGTQRLSAATYLKGPSVFGFNGVYKPFAVDARVVGSELEPGPRCAELVRALGARAGLRRLHRRGARHRGRRLARPASATRCASALRAGRCTTNPGSWLFGQLADVAAS